MTRTMDISPHVIASQALYTARMLTQERPENYRSEVRRQLDRLTMGLTDWEMDRIRSEVEYRLTLVAA